MWTALPGESQCGTRTPSAPSRSRRPAGIASSAVVAVSHSAPPVTPALALEELPSGLVTLNWNATIGQTYQLQSTSDLASGLWVNFGVPLTASNAILTASASPTNQTGSRFSLPRLSFQLSTVASSCSISSRVRPLVSGSLRRIKTKPRTQIAA